MPPLLTLLGIALGATAILVATSPVLRRLAFRQIARRRTEALLIISGSVLGTALIVSSLAVGDSLDTSIRHVAVRALGPIDERITTADPVRGALIAERLEALRSDPDVDGVLTAHTTVGATSITKGGTPRAEPITLLWDLDFAQAATFGGSGSGLSGPAPKTGEVVINDELARRLNAGVGDTVTFFVFGQQTPARVVRVVPRDGLAGAGLGAVVNADAFFAPGTLQGLAWTSGTGGHPLTTTLVSNRGGVESGSALTQAVHDRIDQLLAPGHLTTTVSEAKKETLDAATNTSNQMGSLFLFIGSFSIIAGILLLVNVFVMLAEERKSQLGMLRAVGLTRRRLVGEFAIEGAAYALIAGALGLLVGVVVGRGVVGIAEAIINQWNSPSQQLELSFRVSKVSLVNGFAAGFVIAFITVLLTSVRLSRLNVIAAIRDLPPASRKGIRRGWVIVSSALCALLTAVAVVAIANSAGAAVYLMPALAALAAVPLLRIWLSPRAAWSAVSLGILLWSLTANLFRPAIFNGPSMTTYIVLGVLVTFSAVLLISQNQNVVLWPLRRWLERPTESALTARLAIAYPTARRFRTGATLVMYSIVVFVVVLLTEIGAILASSTNQAVADASAGWTHRVDVNGTLLQGKPMDVLRSGPFAGVVRDVAPLVVAHGTSTDPAHRTDKPLPVVVVGLPDLSQGSHMYPLDKRMAGFADDRAVWKAVAANPAYVVVDNFFGSSGGPGTKQFQPGDSFTVTDPETGATHVKTIVGVMTSAGAFYNIGVGEPGFPILTSRAAVTADFRDAKQSSYLLDAPNVDDVVLAAELQGRFLAAGVVATSIRQYVEQNLAASQSFFRLMQGFLALGLLVGITGLGVVMVRAVRERRRTIGVLRALGFRAKAVQRAFMAESTFVAAEGILIGAVLAVVTTYLLYRNSAAFQGLHGAYPIAWRDVTVILGATFVASILATLGPARRASKIKPAVAVRVAD
ncbi:MAG TPA: FtsX-like permease family protein [Acidimicrobiales bacterium]|nr:FtsX-like permease family protein [Acidimicrobiales bacterium]